MAWPNIHVSKIKIYYAFWNLEFLQGCISQFERVRKLKSSFHILPSSGQRKISKFQLHRFGRSRQPDLPWMSQLPNLSASCIAQSSAETFHSFQKPPSFMDTTLFCLLRTLTSLVPHLPCGLPHSFSLWCPYNAYLSVSNPKESAKARTAALRWEPGEVHIAFPLEPLPLRKWVLQTCI